jgi:hypothetical protein
MTGGYNDAMRRSCLLALILLSGCGHPAPTTLPVAETPPPAPEPKKEPPKKEPPAQTTGRVPSDRPAVVGTVRVSVKKVTVGKVPLKNADRSISYSGEPRLMIAVRIENLNDKRGFEYASWVPDLDAAKTIGKLTDDTGAESKRVPLGFGSNVKDRTTNAAVAAAGAINDLLVFEVPAATAKHLDLDLPGANCKVRGTFQFRIDAAAITRPK